MAAQCSVTGSFSFSDGSTGGIILDLSGLTLYNVTVGITDGPSAIGFTNIKSSYAFRIALDTVRNRIDIVSSLEGQCGALAA